MARGRKSGGGPTITNPIKPESAEGTLSLSRVEERFERVAITPEQAQARLATAAAIIEEANILTLEAVNLSTAARGKKKSAEAKHEEADKIVLEAQNGTTSAPYPVIVERHPSLPTEMIVWRVADGMSPPDVLAAMLDGDHFESREAQGCTLLERRAMTPEEMGAAKIEDWNRQNPELPLPDILGAQPQGEIDSRPDAEVIDFSAHAAQRDAVAGGDAAAAGDSGAGVEGAPVVAAKREVACPYIFGEGQDVRNDVLCGQPGTSRRRGMCLEHYTETGGAAGGEVQAKMLIRRSARTQAIKAAALLQAEEDAREAAAASASEQPADDSAGHVDAGAADDGDEFYVEVSDSVSASAGDVDEANEG